MTHILESIFFVIHVIWYHGRPVLRWTYTVGVETLASPMMTKLVSHKVECGYNTVRFITILHTALRSQRENLYQTLTPQQIPHTPTGEQRGIFCEESWLRYDSTALIFYGPGSCFMLFTAICLRYVTRIISNDVHYWTRYVLWLAYVRNIVDGGQATSLSLTIHCYIWILLSNTAI